MNIWYIINRTTSWHKCKIGGKLHLLKCWIYKKIKNCPHCRESYIQKDKQGELYKRSWVMCPRCGYLYCVHCMPFIDGCGRCPKCYVK